jgi:NAD(P)-dependent dehydrogenase (short-subunit alcohol dehydrogenase family)
MPTATHRTVLITGATRGLGRAMLDRFAEADWIVWACGRDGGAVRALASTYGRPHQFEAVDVSDASAVESWSQRLLTGGVAPDLLINNAAVINANARLWEVPVDQFGQVLDVNVKGTFHVLRAFVPAMIERRRGVIVNFSSGWGRSTSAEVAPYCASKWAIEGLTQALSQELPRGMAAVALNPGIIDTDMLRSCFGGGAAQYDGPDAWSRRAVPFLLSLTAAENGRSLDVPD